MFLNQYTNALSFCDHKEDYFIILACDDYVPTHLHASCPNILQFLQMSSPDEATTHKDCSYSPANTLSLLHSLH